MSALCWTRQTPSSFHCVCDSSTVAVCVCVFEPLESARKKKRKTVVVSCFGDSATHFHLKDEGDRLLLLASAQVQTLKKDYEKQKVAGIKEICFGVK